MSKLSKALIAAAGNSGGAGLTVEDVFSTYLYTGTGSAQTITNGIDLDGEGGLVWLKGRGPTSGYPNIVVDTARGRGAELQTNSSTYTISVPSGNGVSAFNANGFSLGSNWGGENASGESYASWTFRKAEKFFDVVTYTGDGSVQSIAHNLGSVPKCMIVKNTSSTGDWYVYHIDLGAGINGRKTLKLNSTAAQSDSGGFSDHPTSTEFTVNYAANTSGQTYVAYLFASDAGGFGDDGSESIIKCGSYTGNGGTQEINLGFEPQWLLIKNADRSISWHLTDSMRGLNLTSRSELYPNLSNAEWTGSPAIVSPTATGFVLGGANTYTNFSGENFIYIAIRRPMKTPESGTEVFEAITYTGDNSTRELNTTILSDAVRIGSRNTAGWATGLQSRITGKEKLLTSSTGGAAGDSWGKINAWDYQDAIEFTTGSSGFQDVNGSGITYVAHAFKRATGFFDVVAYTGDGVAGRTVAHNLGVAPELMIVKSRSGFAWAVYANPLTASNRLLLNSSDAASSANYWNSTEPTDSVFTVDGNYFQVNGSSATYIAYLFATLAGVSKVGSYTGTGSNVDVDCGFSAGARFILIKRTDSTGDWYVWDSARGIVAGNDPYLLLNSTAAEVTSTDYIDPLASGFTVTSTAPAALNASGGNYIFLAIA